VLKILRANPKKQDGLCSLNFHFFNIVFFVEKNVLLRKILSTQADGVLPMSAGKREQRVKRSFI